MYFWERDSIYMLYAPSPAFKGQTLQTRATPRGPLGLLACRGTPAPPVTAQHAWAQQRALAPDLVTPGARSHGGRGGSPNAGPASPATVPPRGALAPPPAAPPTRGRRADATWEAAEPPSAPGRNRGPPDAGDGPRWAPGGGEVAEPPGPQRDRRDPMGARRRGARLAARPPGPRGAGGGGRA